MYHSVESNHWEEVGDQDFALSMAIFVREKDNTRWKIWSPLNFLEHIWCKSDDHESDKRSECLINVGTCREKNPNWGTRTLSSSVRLCVALQAVLSDDLDLWVHEEIEELNWIMNEKGISIIYSNYWHNNSMGISRIRTTSTLEASTPSTIWKVCPLGWLRRVLGPGLWLWCMFSYSALLGASEWQWQCGKCFDKNRAMRVHRAQDPRLATSLFACSTQCLLRW